jgi:septal ring factor EnvC (AmiA/AmiB activator)
MSEQVPFAKVDVDAAVMAKFGDLVADAGTAALRVLLMGHAMEMKHELVENKYKDPSEDVEKWMHKSTGLEGCLADALKEKKAAEEALEEMKQAKEAAEKERDEKEAALEKSSLAVDEGRRALAVYFENGFRRATEQVLLFNPEAKMESLILLRWLLTESWWMTNDVVC